MPAWGIWMILGLSICFSFVFANTKIVAVNIFYT